MPRLNAIEKFLRELNDSTIVVPAGALTTYPRTKALIAAERLRWANVNTQRGVFAAIDAGAQVRPEAWQNFVRTGKLRERMRDQWPQEGPVLGTDNGFSLPRTICAMGAHNQALNTVNEAWILFRVQIERLLQRGLIQDPDDLLWVADRAFKNDLDFAICLLANSTYSPDTLPGGHPAGIQAMDLHRYWTEIKALRENLFETRWLKAAISADEYQKSMELSASLRQALYAELWDAGYVGFRQQLLSKGRIR